MSNAAFAILLAGTGVLVVVSLRAVFDASYAFVVSSITGEVMRERKHQKTEVSGSISGHGGSRYSSGSVSGSVSSKTTSVQEIFLQLPNGKERELSFTDFDLPSREGNRLSVIYLSRQGAAEAVCAFHNHATDQSVVFSKVIKRVTRPPIARVAILWGGFTALFALLNSWADGGFAEDGLATDFIAFTMIAVLAAGLTGVVLHVASSLRGIRRVGTVRAAIDTEIASAETSAG